MTPGTSYIIYPELAAPPACEGDANSNPDFSVQLCPPHIAKPTAEQLAGLVSSCGSPCGGKPFEETCAGRCMSRCAARCKN